MKRIWHRLFVLLFLGFYLTPALELNAEESKANYSNECHQYITCSNEQSFIVAKTVKQPIQQKSGFVFLTKLSSQTPSFSFVLFADDPLILQRIFLLHSVLII